MSLAQGTRLAPARLGALVRQVAAAGRWPAAVMFDASGHWYHRLELTDEYETWLLGWLPGQHTGFHDHGEASGAFAVVRGELAESLARPGRRRVRRRCAPTYAVTTFGPRHLHDLGNESGEPAVSVHAYSPPLTAMRRYAMTESGLALVRTDHAELDW
jgi:predicted metal-dependent enzyme (double-stranded beta helix superfamily)